MIDIKKYSNVSEILGKILIEVSGGKDSDEITFKTSDGKTYLMSHEQDCCENVTLEDVNGDLNNLIGSTIVLAEEITNCDDPAKSSWDDSYTWTYYKFATNKGYVTLRWYGESNGYYSESVDFMEVY